MAKKAASKKAAGNVGKAKKAVVKSNTKGVKKGSC